MYQHIKVHANKHRLKKHYQEMFAASKLAANEGIHTTWRNKSNTLRLAHQMQTTGKLVIINELVHLIYQPLD
jgi:hypothetical protein